MAKNKSTRKQRTPQARAAVKHTSPAATSTHDRVILNTAFGPVEVPQALARKLPSTAAPAERDEADFTILDLSDCDHELTSVSPGMAQRALIEGERLDPHVALQLVRDFAFLTPTLMIFGERGRLLSAAPTLRRVRRASLCSGTTQAALMGMVYDKLRVVLARFENGPTHHAAADELVRMFESWDGRLLIFLVGGRPPETGPIEVGNIIAAHEVDLDRPMFERAIPNSREKHLTRGQR